MNILVILLSLLLWVWFLGCTVTYRVGGRLLVEGMGVRSVEFAVLVLYTAGIALYLLWRPVGRPVLLGELSLWLLAQFLCHEYHTVAGASPKKLSGYNQCFRDTLKLFPPSRTRLIPDLYHIVLHLLIALDLTAVALSP